MMCLTKYEWQNFWILFVNFSNLSLVFSCSRYLKYDYYSYSLEFNITKYEDSLGLYGVF